MVGADEVVNDGVIEESKETRQSTRRDSASGPGAGQSAHIRTAGMLFVVTVVFVLTFAPAFFMSFDVVPYNRLIFYVYFFNNVANPVIYSFMNSYFRHHLYPMFCHFNKDATLR